MAKPPADVDPEKFIIGRGAYSNLRTAKPVFSDGVFRLDPVPIPYLSIVIHDIVFMMLFFCAYWFVNTHTTTETVRWIACVLLTVICMMTCILFTTFVWYEFAKQNRLGPWLNYHVSEGRLELPREGEVFARNEIVHVQYITTSDRDYMLDRMSELNLITCRDDIRKRWPLLRSTFNFRAFDRLLKPLLEHTDLPVMRVKEEGLISTKITEQPWP